MDSSIRIVIADDHPVVVDGLQNVLSRQPEISIVGTATSFRDLDRVLEQHSPQILILDLNGMGGSALSLMEGLQRSYPDLSVIIFSSIVDLAPELLDAGVRGYVAKEDLTRELLTAILAVANGDLCVSPLVRKYLEESSQKSMLSPKELTAVKLLAHGANTQKIAEQMGVTIDVAQNYITHSRRKTGCMQRTELVEWYRNLYGLDTP
jgi:DNA-binding NarL/FixJ family response regulator